jgi:hypothetical protein
MRLKYLKDIGIYYEKHRPFWSNMLQVRDIYLCGRRMKVGSETLTSFWGDSWCSISPLKDMFPVLFDIAMNKESLLKMHLLWAGDSHIGDG